VSSYLQSTNTVEPFHPLRDVAAIIEFDVAATRHDFDSRLGPRLVVTIANPVVHAGLAPAESEFRQAGGPLPDGHFSIISELPRFAAGGRYIVFLPAIPWFFTPATAGLAFRVERFSTKSIVTGMAGTPVLGFDCTGIRFGRTRVVQDRPDLAAPLAAPTRVAGVTEADPDVAAALTREQFVANAMAAAQAAGAKLGAPVTLTPDPTRTWTRLPMTAPLGPVAPAPPNPNGCRWGAGSRGLVPASDARIAAHADGGAP
jgi:hypothetical protein